MVCSVTTDQHQTVDPAGGDQADVITGSHSDLQSLSSVLHNLRVGPQRPIADSGAAYVGDHEEARRRVEATCHSDRLVEVVFPSPTTQTTPGESPHHDRSRQGCPVDEVALSGVAVDQVNDALG